MTENKPIYIIIRTTNKYLADWITGRISNDDDTEVKRIES